MDPDGSMAFVVARYSIGAGPVGVHHSLLTENGERRTAIARR